MQLKKVIFIFLIILYSINLVSAETITVSGTTGADIQNAINEAKSGDTITLPAGDYYVTRRVYQKDKDLTIKGTGAILHINTGTVVHNGLFFEGSQITKQAATGKEGSNQVVLNDASRVQAGDLLKIWKDVKWCPDDYPNQMTGELYLVKSVSGNTVTLTESLLRDYPSGSDSIIYRPVEIHIEGLEIQDSSSTTVHEAIALLYCVDSSVSDCTIRDSGFAGISFYCSFNVKAYDNDVRNCIKPGSGYGVGIWSGTAHADVYNNYIENCRHCITLNSDRLDTLTRDSHIYNNRCIGGQTGGAIVIDAHPIAIDWLVENNDITVQSGWYALNDGAYNTVFQNNKIKGGYGAVIKRGDITGGTHVIKDNTIEADNGFTYRAWGNSHCDNLVITGNTQTGGRYGVFLGEEQPETYENVIIRDNSFSKIINQGIYLDFQRDGCKAEISDNTFSNIGKQDIYINANKHTGKAIIKGNTLSKTNGLMLVGLTASDTGELEYSYDVSNDDYQEENEVENKPKTNTYTVTGCDGKSDQEQINEALKQAKNGDTIILTQDLTISKPITTTGKSFVLDGNGHQISIKTDDGLKNGLLFSGRTVTSSKLSESASEGSYTVTLQDAGKVQAGDLIKIYKSVLWCPKDYPEQKTGEMYEVRSVSDNTITLTEPLLRDYPLSDDSRVLVLRPVEIHITNLKIQDSDPIGDRMAITLEACKDSSVKNVDIRDSGLAALSLYSCYDVEVSGCDIRNSIKSGSGYGVGAWSGSANIDIHDNYIENCRHCITGNTNERLTLLRDISIHDNELIGATIEGANPVDAHAITLNYEVKNNKITVFKSFFAFIDGSLDSDFSGNEVYGGRGGVVYRGNINGGTHTIKNNYVDKGYVCYLYGGGTKDKLIIENNKLGSGVNEVSQASGKKVSFNEIVIDGNTVGGSAPETDRIEVTGCDGTADQVEINQAIKAGDYIILSGDFCINGPIILDSNTVLDGQGQTTITIPDNANRLSGSEYQHKATKDYANKMVPLIRANNCKNIEITGIHFDGNADRQTDLITGRGFYNFIMPTGCDGVNVHDCTGSNSLGDFLRATKCSNVEFKDIEAHKLGHEALFAIKSDYVEMSGCSIDCRINNAARIRDSNHAYIHDNFITCTARESAGPGVQLDKTDKNMEMNVEVCNNVFKMTGGPGMWIAGTQSNYDESNSQIKIHHNAFLSTGWDWRNWQAGILISGVHNVNIFNNVFDGCSNAGIVTYSVNGLSKGANGANFCIDIQDNIITNTKAGHNTGSGMGYGISNTLENSHKIISKDNILWGNSAGNYNRCSGSDYEQDPRVNPGSSEWYWTGSAWECDYVSAEMTMRGGTGVEDIEDEDFEPGPEREFDSIFDVLGTTFYDIAGGSYEIILPENITEIPTESTWTIEQHENSALIYGPTEGMTSIKCEYAGKEGVHTVMIGERIGWTMTYNTVSTWKGDIQRTGDSFYLDGKVNPEDLKITCYTPKGTFEPQIDIIEVENEVNSFNYYILFYLIIVGILLSVPVCVLYIVFVWR